MFVTASGKVATSIRKVVTSVRKVATPFGSFATTTEQYKTRAAKFVASNHTKSSTFAIEKIAKELAFFPSREGTFQQFERF